MFLASALVSLSPIIPVAHAEAPTSPKTAPESVLVSESDMRSYVQERAEKLGVSAATVEVTITCESNWDVRAWNKKDPGDGSKGIAQFQDGTFAMYSKLAGVEHGDVWSAKDSIDTMVYMFSIGQQRQWSCYRKIYDKN